MFYPKTKDSSWQFFRDIKKKMFADFPLRDPRWKIMVEEGSDRLGFVDTTFQSDDLAPFVFAIYNFCITIAHM